MAEQCRWFGGTANPQENADCARPARKREYGLVLCDPHYDAAHMDPEDWTDEMNARATSANSAPEGRNP
jgi:hypothetical protein